MADQKRKSKPRKKVTPKKKVAQKKRAPPAVKKFNSVRFGQRVGRMFGPAAGRVGAEAGRLFRQVTGFGDYKVGSNTLLSSMDRLPSFRNTLQGTKVTHREYLGDVITSPTAGAFQIKSYPIQPALLTTFPWLANSAENYQEYQLNGLIFEFKSNSYDALASTNTASGTVVMATNYNVLDPPYANKFQMEQSQYVCSGKPSINLLHPVECAKAETPTNILFTRSGLADGDYRLYDWGNFQLATVGMQGTSTNIGELWVTYDITLYKPKLGLAVDLMDQYALDLTDTKAGGTTFFGSVAHPPVLRAYSDMGTTLSDSKGDGKLDTITWPITYFGYVLVSIIYNVTTTDVATHNNFYGATLAGGVSLTYGYNSGASASNEAGTLRYNGNGGATFLVYLKVAGGGSMTLTGGSTSLSLNWADLTIIALPSNFLSSPALDAPSRPLLQRPSLTLDVKHSSRPRPLLQRCSDEDDVEMKVLPSETRLYMSTLRKTYPPSVTNHPRLESDGDWSMGDDNPDLPITSKHRAPSRSGQSNSNK